MKIYSRGLLCDQIVTEARTQLRVYYQTCKVNYRVCIKTLIIVNNRDYRQ